MPRRNPKVVKLGGKAAPAPPAPEPSINQQRLDALARHARETGSWEKFQEEEIKPRAKAVADASLDLWLLELRARFPEAVVSERRVIFNINVSDAPENVIKLQHSVEERGLKVRAIEVTRAPVGIRVLCE